MIFLVFSGFPSLPWMWCLFAWILRQAAAGTLQSWPRLFEEYRGKVGVYCQLMGPGDADVLLNVLMNPVKNDSEALEQPPSMRHNGHRWKPIKHTLLINLSRHPQINQHNIPPEQRSFLSVFWLNQHHNSNLITCILTYLNQKCIAATASSSAEMEKSKLQHSFTGNRSYKVEFIIYLIWKKVLQYVNSNQSEFPKGTNHWNKLKLMCSASVFFFVCLVFFSCTSLPSAPKIRPQWTSGWS